MPASDLESVLPAVGVTLPSGASLKEGAMNVNFTIAGPVDKLVTSGPVKLSNGKLAGLIWARRWEYSRHSRAFLKDRTL